ncbi:hypothetical protein FCR2A7T_06870 [Flavobacterium cauense R2A-7]|uniref:Immunity protein 42 of polymorphic toxin system n=1 Tax=Flavobacterium cauense R2A-7 TaxID=1341154 RepID=V6S4C0_9FLAO|nr:hypothetical protein [Flavobacterium cauense]ESU21259.1 hypothetical protein FCR2A7T_06870 [Flavobacterium cauense R2A-7]KGO79021.1 hypothetical protein Q762_14730 [Flavobacterium cauense R2A-7]TWI07392.1 hypothetical protein IP98_02950 [Flavobacterium cauense R2A-7]
MKFKNFKYFGDKNTFAIRYASSEYSEDHAYCNLILGGQVIGYDYEDCYLPFWRAKIEIIKDNIKFHSNSLYHHEFDNRTDREIFELIFKASKEYDDDNNEYGYLPVLEYEIWHYCSISIDKTTDSYFVTMAADNDCDKIKFIWEGWIEPCPNENIGKLFSVTVDKELVIEAMEKFLAEVHKDK